MLNRVILIGRLTRDPELRYTSSSGIPTVNFTLAVDRAYQSSRGDRETDFIRIVCWRKLAEHCKEYLSKGKLVAVEGRLQVRNWETPQGERRTIAEIVADNVRFLDRASAPSQPRHEEEAAPESDSYDDSNPMTGEKEPRKKNFGDISDQEVDEEIDLDEDDPF